MSAMKEYKRLLPFLRKYLVFYLPGLVCLVLTDAGQLYIPQLTKGAVDLAASGDFYLSEILRISFFMVLTAVLIAAGRFGWRFFIGGTARKIESGLREMLFNHMMTLPASFYGKRKTGDIMARFTNDMQAVRMACGMAVVSLVDGVFMAAFILILLFINYPSIAGWIILPFPILAFLVLGMGRLLGRRSKLVQEGFSSLSAIVQETFSGIRVFKTLARENYAVDKFRESNDEYMKRSMSLVRIWGLFFPLINLLAGCTSLLLLWFGGSRIISGDLSPGDFAAVLSYLGLLVWPMMGAGFTINWLERGAASLSRIGEFLDAEPEITNPPAAAGKGARDGERRETKAAGVSGDLEFRDLTFRWPDDEADVLSDISFTVPEGASVGIFGRTGSGKSSLVNLVPRIFDPPAGTIFIGGRDVRDYPLKDLRTGVGLVLQDSFLFSETIKENIRFAAPDVSDDKILEAAEFSTISRDLNEFPFGWDTMVGERGHTLSGGQKQRIAISRAYLTNPEILVFDDCLSAVDSETEAGILNMFLKMRKRKTSLIISNRTGTLASTDFIVVLEEGKISRIGAHEELINTDGLYKNIHRLQQVEYEGR
jgi:ATP-binding cassette subfamily B protein